MAEIVLEPNRAVLLAGRVAEHRRVLLREPECCGGCSWPECAMSEGTGNRLSRAEVDAGRTGGDVDRRVSRRVGAGQGGQRSGLLRCRLLDEAVGRIVETGHDLHLSGSAELKDVADPRVRPVHARPCGVGDKANDDRPRAGTGCGCGEGRGAGERDRHGAEK